MNFFHILIFG